MKLALMILSTVGVLASVGHPSTATAETQSSESKEFAREWMEVKERYPSVAMAHLRQKAFIYQVGQFLRSRAVLDEYRVFCHVGERLGVQIGQCQDITMVIGDIGSCFDLQRTVDGGLELPSAEDAEACVQREMRPRLP